MTATLMQKSYDKSLIIPRLLRSKPCGADDQFHSGIENQRDATGAYFCHTYLHGGITPLEVVALWKLCWREAEALTEAYKEVICTNPRAHRMANLAERLEYFARDLRNGIEGAFLWRERPNDTERAMLYAMETTAGWYVEDQAEAGSEMMLVAEDYITDHPEVMVKHVEGMLVLLIRWLKAHGVHETDYGLLDLSTLEMLDEMGR